MIDPLARTLRNEPKPALKAFFAARVTASVKHGREPWMSLYWAAAMAASALIVILLDWGPVLGVPVSLWIARSDWRRWMPRR